MAHRWELIPARRILPDPDTYTLRLTGEGAISASINDQFLTTVAQDIRPSLARLVLPNKHF
jgi:hypothetical protein